MLKRLGFFSAVIFLLLSLFSPARAADDRFSVSLTSRYTFTATGSSQVKQNFTVKNLTSRYLISSYELFFPGDLPANLHGTDSKGKLTFQTEKKAQGTLIRVLFNTVAAGKNESLDFTLIFNGPNAVHHDNVWELTLPMLAATDSISQYTLELSVPETFGLLAYSTLPTNAQPESTAKNSVYSFSDPKAATSGLTAVFGEFQTWGFRLDYQINNPANHLQKYSLLLPPDSIGQRISFNSITPAPMDIEVNPSGNWIGIYQLAAKQELDVRLEGQIRLSSSTAYRGSVPPASILAFTSPGIEPDAALIRPYHTEIFYDTYAASFPKINLDWHQPVQYFPGLSAATYLDISNTGNVAAYSLPVTVQTEGITIDFKSTPIPVIPPLSVYHLPVTATIDFTGLLSGKQVVFTVNNESITYNISATQLIIAYGFITLLSAFALIGSAAIAYKAGSLHIQKYLRPGHLRRKG